MTSSLGQTVQRFFERQLAPPAALRQSCSDEFERSMSRWLPPNKCDCRKRRNADHPFDPEIAPRRLLFFLSAERDSAGKRWLLGAAGNAVRAEGRRISVPLPPKEMCSTSSPTGWCHCHHDTTSALCRAEPRSVGALDRTPLPVGCLASEKSTIYITSTNREYSNGFEASVASTASSRQERLRVCASLIVVVLASGQAERRLLGKPQKSGHAGRSS